MDSDIPYVIVRNGTARLLFVLISYGRLNQQLASL